MREIVLNGLEKDFRSNEAYKKLRTNIEFSGEENKVLVFTLSLIHISSPRDTR